MDSVKPVKNIAGNIIKNDQSQDYYNRKANFVYNSWINLKQQETENDS